MECSVPIAVAEWSGKVFEEDIMKWLRYRMQRMEANEDRKRRCRRWMSIKKIDEEVIRL